MNISIPKEQTTGELRVAATPSSVAQLIKLGFDVAVEQGAGKRANFSDSDYEQAGATIKSKKQIFTGDVILKVNAPTDNEIALIKEGATLIGLMNAAHNPELLTKLQAKKITTLSMDCVPRISRAQSMDALSSMANIAGYRAVVEAAFEFGRFFTGQITAAGKVPPAKVLVIGAGVAGLAAIGTAHSLGAIVRAFDTRPEVREQVQSMGAEFLEVHIQEEASSGDGYAKVMSPEYIKAEMELFAAQAKEVDIIITTALIPGKPAPKLITADMVASMKSGSVIVDLAAANGGNCELTEKDRVIHSSNGVKIIGYTDLPSRLPTQSSQLYATNLLNLIKLLCKQKDGTLQIDFEDEIIRSATVVREAEITFPPPPIKVSAAPKKPATANASAPVEVKEPPKKLCPCIKYGVAAVAALLLAWLFENVENAFLAHFSVFVLACIVGYYVVWNVSGSLHTPLMSVTNAISGIIIIGVLLQIGSGGFVSFLAFVGILLVSINIFGGFVVTQRMLKMFRK